MGKRNNIQPFLLFLFLIPVLFLFFNYVVGFNGLYGQDAHEYLHYSRAIRLYFFSGTVPPPFHWPVLFPFLGASIGLLTGDVQALQLISISSLCMSLYFIYKILCLFYGGRRRVLAYVLVFGLLSSYFLRLGVCSMSDMLAIFFCSGALYFITLFTLEGRNRALIPALGFTAAAVFARYPSVWLLFPPLCFAFIGSWKRVRMSNLLPALPFILLAAVPALLLHPAFPSVTAGEWSFLNFFRRDFDNPGSGHLHYGLPNLVFNLGIFFHPGFVLLGLIFLFFVKKEDLLVENQFLFLVPVLLYVLFLSGFMIQNTRLCTLAFPFVLMLYYPAWERLTERFLARSRKSMVVGAAVAVQCVLFYFAFNDFTAANKLERSIAQVVAAKRPGRPVITLGMEGPLLSYTHGREIISMTQQLHLVPSPALVVVNPALMASQWKGGHEEGLWRLIEPYCNRIAIFEKGWELYEYR